MIHNESYVEIPCSDESFMVTFEIMEIHYVPSKTMKNKNSLNFIIEG